MRPWDLIAAAAWNLTRQRLILRDRKPIYPGYSAIAQKNLEGVPVVDFDPAIPDGDFLRIFCHEMAHVKLHVSKFAPSDVDRRPQSVKDAPRPPIARVAYAVRETEADKLADRWQVYAILFSDFQQGQTELERQLKALERMPKP